MALVLQLVPGEDFYIGDERYVLKQIMSETAFTIERERDRRAFHLVDDRAVLLEADVYASVGTRGQRNLAKLCIEAPRSIAVIRGKLHRGRRSGI